MELSAHVPSLSFNETSLNESLQYLKEVLEKHDIPVSTPAPVSFEKFDRLTFAEQERVIANIRSCCETWAGMNDVEIEAPSHPDVEISRIKRAMQKFELCALDESIFSLIEEGDIIEIYNADGAQIYRNIAFFKICSYSLLDLLVNSWDELYEKPTTVTSTILNLVERVLTDAPRTLSYDLGTFIQRERYSFSQTLKTFLAKPKYISPFIDQETGERAAFMSTYQGEMIAEGNASLQLEILGSR